MLIIRITTLLLLWIAYSHAETSNYVYEYEEGRSESMLIEGVTSLEKDSLLARKQNIPILIEFTTPWCSYCEALEQQVLEPLLRSEEFKGKIIIKKLEINDYSEIIGFDGKNYSAYDISQKYKVKLYPTLVFFDSNGKEIKQRIIGITLIDDVTERLDNTIRSAINEISSTSNTK